MSASPALVKHRSDRAIPRTTLGRVGIAEEDVLGRAGIAVNTFRRDGTTVAMLSQAGIAVSTPSQHGTTMTTHNQDGDAVSAFRRDGTTVAMLSQAGIAVSTPGQHDTHSGHAQPGRHRRRRVRAGLASR